MLALALTLALATPQPDTVRVAILGLRNDGVDPSTISQVVDALALHLSKHERAQVLTATEIQAVLGLEATKQALDCTTDSCAIDEVTKSLDVKYIVGGSVAPRAGGVLVHASLVDVQRAIPVVRTAADADLDDLRDDLLPVANELAAAAFGSPVASETVLLQQTSSGFPPLSWIGLAAGGLGLAVGTVGGILWAVDDATIRATDTLFDAKEDARSRYVVDQALVGAGAGILVVGAGVTALGLALQE